MSSETEVAHPEGGDGETKAQASTWTTRRGCRFLRVSQEVENYILSLALRMYIPLLPVVLDFWQRGQTSAKSLVLVAGLYGISIGVASRRRSLFGLTFASGVTFIAAYGIILGGQHELPQSRPAALVAIAAIVIVHALERWNRHVRDCEPALDCML